MLRFLKPKPPELFFIRGYAKSGTNWLCNLMNLHPQVRCCGEFHFPTLFRGLLGEQEDLTALLKKNENRPILEDRLHQMIRDLVVDVCGPARLCGDRTPCPLRSLIIPDSKTLYITRDGRDAMVSWTYHSMNLDIEEWPEMKAKVKQVQADPNYFETHKNELLSCEQSVRAFAAQWNAVVCDDFDVMRAADRGEIPLDYHWVRYEDLHRDTLARRDEIYRFLNLKPKQAQPLTAKTEAGFGNGKTNRPHHFYRRGCAGTWQEYFTDEQRNWFESEASEALQLVAA
ncbi:Sulfotransferase domain protein [Rosistilla carotiformis]|uniref:Sulfotransferase domain protein n=1 Tax=Rosistilla carotiformis TaxID=2528017 RepID=A0A518K145_9BACT|nr:sulfotransferase domain-containing protein [Rosistilla carotiformis]QDV71511.1 Sulfotransferase domain protein [Rosistilla carotiformis]